MKKYLIMLLIANITMADCNKALNACIVLKDQQDTSITMLKGQNTDLENRLAEATKPPLLTPIHYILIGVLTGSLGMLYLKH